MLLQDHDLDLLRNVMEEMNFDSKSSKKFQLLQWLEITREYNRQLGTNFRKRQVQKVWENHCQKVQTTRKLGQEYEAFRNRKMLNTNSK